MLGVDLTDTVKFFGMSRRADGGDGAPLAGPWQMLTRAEADELAARYNENPDHPDGGKSRAFVIEFYRYDNDPLWPEEYS